MPTDRGRAQTAAAIAEHQRRAVQRAVDDPIALARAAKIVRTALARQKLRLTDVVPEPADDQAAS